MEGANGHTTAIVVGGTCIVLFGFMFYKQTMLQAEIKRLRAALEGQERQQLVRQEVQNLAEGSVYSEPVPAPEPERFVPPPRDAMPLADPSTKRRRRSESPEAPEVGSSAEIQESAASFFQRPDPMMTDPSAAGELPAEIGAQIEQLIAQRRATTTTTTK
jgi:hypothetical protein